MLSATDHILVAKSVCMYMYFMYYILVVYAEKDATSKTFSCTYHDVWGRYADAVKRSVISQSATVLENKEARGER